MSREQIRKQPKSAAPEQPELSAARLVLETEANALLLMADELDGAFVEAIDVLAGFQDG